MSTLYHSFKPNITAKKVFRVFDHCSIFLLIFGTYVPYTLVTLHGALGWTLFGIVLGAAVLGIVLNSINLEKYKKMSMTTASLQRDLHCFNMSCSVVLAPYTSYNFSFRCNAATLTDALKYDKRSGYSNAVQWY